MKKYIARGQMLMHEPAVILHKGQMLAVPEDTVEIFSALASGLLEPVKTEFHEEEPEPLKEKMQEMKQKKKGGKHL